jgi:osmotically-inducible protein OsmY
VSTKDKRVRHLLSKPFAALLTVAVAASTLAGCATYRKCGFAGCAGDAQITAHVEALLRENKAIEEWGIKVQTLDRVVYLYGLVDTNLERNIIEATALEVPGVTRVVDSIAVRGNVW